MSDLKLPRFKICGLHKLQEASATQFSHVISIWDSAMKKHEPNVIKEMKGMFPKARLHVTFFDDIEEPEKGYTEPKPAHLKRVFAFASSIKTTDSVLVHCFAGLSRSPAVAFSLACRMCEPGSEQKALDYLLTEHPRIAPNRLIVQIADEILNRNGAMSAVNDLHCANAQHAFAIRTMMQK